MRYEGSSQRLSRLPANHSSDFFLPDVRWSLNPKWESFLTGSTRMVIRERHKSLEPRIFEPPKPEPYGNTTFGSHARAGSLAGFGVHSVCEALHGSYASSCPCIVLWYMSCLAPGPAFLKLDAYKSSDEWLMPVLRCRSFHGSGGCFSCCL